MCVTGRRTSMQEQRLGFANSLVSPPSGNIPIQATRNIKYVRSKQMEVTTAAVLFEWRGRSKREGTIFVSNDHRCALTEEKEEIKAALHNLIIASRDPAYISSTSGTLDVL